MARNRGKQGCSFVCARMLDSIDLVIEFDYEITCDAIPQSWDEPASDMEYEVTFTGVYEDTPEANNNNIPKKYLDTPPWLERAFQDYLEENMEDVYHQIAKDLEEW